MSPVQWMCQAQVTTKSLATPWDNEPVLRFSLPGLHPSPAILTLLIALYFLSQPCHSPFPKKISLPIISHPAYIGFHKGISKDSDSPCNCNGVLLPQGCKIPGWGRLDLYFDLFFSVFWFYPTSASSKERYLQFCFNLVSHTAWLHSIIWSLTEPYANRLMCCLCCSFISGCSAWLRLTLRSPIFTRHFSLLRYLISLFPWPRPHTQNWTWCILVGYWEMRIIFWMQYMFVQRLT